MTVVVCLNFGDRIYLGSDTLVTQMEKERLKPKGYCFKLYELGEYNAVIGFAGSVYSAKSTIAKLADYVSSATDIDEVNLFEKIPGLLADECKNWNTDSIFDLDIMYAGLIPNSKAYEYEKYPGLGIPPKSICGYFSISGSPRKVTSETGKAIHVPSNPRFKMISSDPRFLMDGFVIGSGARRIKHPEHFYELKYGEIKHTTKTFVYLLQTFFMELAIEISGVGGAYQVAVITEQGIEMNIIDPRDNPQDNRIELKQDAIWITNDQTGKKEVVKSIWDDRYPFEFDEYECIL